MKSVSPKSNLTPALSAATLLFFFAGPIVHTAFPERAWATWVLATLFIASLGGLVWNLRGNFNRRTTLFGLNSATIVLLVVAMLGVINFIAVKYPKKIDLTKNQVNTLSDQTKKVFHGLTVPVKLIYWAKMEEREKVRPLFENLKSLSTKVEVEYLDTVKEITRAKQAGIRQDSTLQLTVGTRDTKIEVPNEEKITNGVIKLLKNSSPLLCAVSEHGEKDFDSNAADGYELAKQTLIKQSYGVKKINLIADGKIPASCSVLAIIGPTKAFFEPEVKLVRDYLANGGAAVFALDLDLKGENIDASPELTKLLTEWGIESDQALVVDPVSQVMRLEATVPIIPTFSKEVSITKDMQGNTVFPLTRSFRIGQNPRPGLKVQWLTQTTPNAWGETNIAGLTKGTATFEKGKDLQGPLYTALAAEGNSASSVGAEKKKTRIVVFGTSLIAANQWTRFGNNLDLFANSVSWLLEDESLISIRTKDEAGGTIQLSAIQGGLIRLLTVMVIPGIMCLTGILVWLRRKKL
ncbi:MAG: GldG family protein [Cryobacterium sp.]|nr:GldG family protein [Oligoflexia bacterium]